jgi:hypothetical protein
MQRFVDIRNCIVVILCSSRTGVFASTKAGSSQVAIPSEEHLYVAAKSQVAVVDRSV